MDNTMPKTNYEKRLEDELTATRNSLRRQTIRCHQIISALTKQIQQKEEEAQHEKLLRDRQLSTLLRTLYNFEARLKREQRSIRQQLQDKDLVIASQLKDIEELKKTSLTTHLNDPKEETRPEELSTVIGTKPDLITSIINPKDEPFCCPNEKKHRVTFDTDCTYFSNDWSNISENILDNFDAYELNQNSLESFSNDDPCKNDSSIEFQNEINSFDLIKSNVDSVALSSTLTVLPLPQDSDNFETDVSTPKVPVAFQILKKQSPSSLIQEIKIGSDSDKDDCYQNNPVLKCVNQILLRDEEDYLEEQRDAKSCEANSNSSSFPQEILDGQNGTPKNTSPVTVFKTYPVFKGQKDEKVYYPLATKLLSVPKVMSNKNLSLKNLPPALPPKPQSLLKNKNKNVCLNSSLDTNPFTHNLNKASANQQLARPIQMKNMEKLNSVLQAIQDNDSPFPKPPSPNDELYVISNSALSNNDDDDQDLITSQSIFSQTGLLERNMELENCLSFSSSRYSAEQVLLNPSFSSSESSSDNNLVNLLPNSLYPSNTNSDQVSPSVSQMVKKFENFSSKPGKISKKDSISGSKENLNDFSQNFEEFCLEDCDIESVCSNKSENSRIDAEGSEVVLSIPQEDESVSYENFLEVTGLSQKSIMTPSRMFSNHKNVLKPKDVKHRNKVKANNVGIFQRCATATSMTGPTIKYWTEPFL